MTPPGSDRAGALPPPPAPDLPPAVALHRASREQATRTVGGVALFFVVLAVLYAALSGDHSPAPAAVLVLGGVLLFGAPVTRSYVCAGPGWLVKRGLVGRAWVRTDQLVLLETSGTSNMSFRMRDADGRRMNVGSADLGSDLRLLARVHADVQRAVAAGAALDPDVVALLAPDAPGAVQPGGKRSRRR